MKTKVRIEIPKDFYENKPSVTLDEFLEMFTEMVKQVKEIEDNLDYELTTEFKAIRENVRLKERIKELEDEFKRLGLEGAL